MRGRAWQLALVLVLLSNAWALAGVAWNRSGLGGPAIRLTERELPFERTGEENTGHRLGLEFRSAPRFEWLGVDTLDALGFARDLAAEDAAATEYYRSRRPRRAYVALELEGAAWRARLQQVRDDVRRLEARTAGDADTALSHARQLVTRAETSESRLYAVAADRDPDRLAARFPDRSRVLIVPAVIAIAVEFQPRSDDGIVRPGPARIVGRVQSVLTRRIHLPRDLAASVSGIRRASRRGSESGPRYTVDLRLGRRFEPWVEAIAPTD